MILKNYSNFDLIDTFPEERVINYITEHESLMRRKGIMRLVLGTTGNFLEYTMEQLMIHRMDEPKPQFMHSSVPM